MRNIATGSLIALGLTLSACDSSTMNRGVESVHQPVVQRTDYVFDVNLGGDGLAAGEAARLSGWFDSLRVAYGDKVSVDTGDNGNAHAAISTVASVAGAHGMTLQPHAPVTQGTIAPGAVRVVISRTVASVPGCPDYNPSILAKFNSTATTNYGCATNASLAAMIANPEDLVQGRTGNGGDATTISTNQVNTTAISTYYGKVSQQAGQVKTESTKGN